MRETRQQRKERLKAAGLWGEYVALREKLAGAGMTPKEAAREALVRVEARPQRQADPPATGPADADDGGEDAPAPQRKIPPRPPLCHRCRHFRKPLCAPCLKVQRKVADLRDAGFGADARWLKAWIEEHLNDEPVPSPAECPGMTGAEHEIVLRLPPDSKVAGWLVYNGHAPRNRLQERAKGVLDAIGPEAFLEKCLLPRDPAEERRCREQEQERQRRQYDQFSQEMERIATLTDPAQVEAAIEALCADPEG
jgi:hypothetical protein